MKHSEHEFKVDDVGARGRVTGDEWLALSAVFETLFSESQASQKPALDPLTIEVLQEDDGEID